DRPDRDLRAFPRACVPAASTETLRENAREAVPRKLSGQLLRPEKRARLFFSLRSAAPSEASSHFSQDRQFRAKLFVALSSSAAPRKLSGFFSAACRKALPCRRHFA